MDVEKIFSYIRIPKDRGIDTLLKEIEKLKFGKLSYSIQELQSMDILSDENENKRILEETEKYLGLCNQFLYRNTIRNTDSRRLLGGRIEKKDISEDIDIDLSNLESKIFTLADLSFKANKLTKVLCERIIEIVIGENKLLNIDGNIGLKRIIQGFKVEGESRKHKGLVDIYRNSNWEAGKRAPIRDQLTTLKNDLASEEYNGWKKSFIQADISDEDALELLFNDLYPIWQVRDVLYEIKSQLNTELIRCLIEDNYTQFRNWGFAKDEHGSWVFNFDAQQVVERYGYHLPMKENILSDKIINELEQGNIPYKLDFTSTVRKNNMDRIIGKEQDGQAFLTSYKTRLVNLLKTVDLENYTEDEYSKINELYILGKLMTVGTCDRIIIEYPELKEQCNFLKALVFPSKECKKDLSTLKEDKYMTRYEQNVHDQIVDILKRTKRIYIQSGENLDKKASIYALRKYMRNYMKENYGIDNFEIEVVEMDAGEKIKIGNNGGLFIDAGKLEGIENYFENYHEKKRQRVEINANISRAQKSTCGVLSQYGFDVPDKIVQYADTVLDETILVPKYGVNIARSPYISGEKLFKLATVRREDGSYLIESELTDDELREYSKKTKKGEKDIVEYCDDIQKERERDIKDISENMYVIHTEKGDKYVAVLDHHVNYGAMISYSLGCDYYISVADKSIDGTKAKDNLFGTDPNIPKVTFAVNSNPKKGDGRLPEDLLNWCIDLRDKGENELFKMYTVPRSCTDKVQRKVEEKPWVKDSKDMVVFGGRKTPHLFVTYAEGVKSKGKTLKDEIIQNLLNLLGGNIKKIDTIQPIKDSVSGWKNISAQTLLYQMLSDTELTLTDVEREVKMIECIAKEKGGIEHDGIAQN